MSNETTDFDADATPRIGLSLSSDVTEGGTANPSSPFEPGFEVAGRYRIQELLGSGGMSRVWLARDAQEQRDVALKELTTVMAASFAPTASELLFRHEFYSMKKLEHPHTVQVFDAGIVEGIRYITMDVVDGQNLDALIRQGTIPLARIYEILTQLAQVLAFIHARQFVHCDIKASNIRITPDGRLKLLDFGIMHPLGVPATRAMLGTPSYMAPERQLGAVLDARTDLYSVGVLGFLLATRRLPFHGRSAALVFDAHRERLPTPPSSLAEVPPPLEKILLKLLEKAPRDRFDSAASLLIALAEASGKPLVEAPLAARASYVRTVETVGRRDEIDRLCFRLETVCSGKASRALFIVSDGGVGKSRLVSELEFMAHDRDVPVVTAQCRSEGLAPLAPIMHALRSLAAITPPELRARGGDALARLLARIDDAKQGTSAEAQPAQLESLAWWMHELGKLRPFVLVFENLHWADHATIEFMNVIIRALDSTGGLVVGTVRPEAFDLKKLAYQTVTEGFADRLDLRPLTRVETEELVESVLGGLKAPASFTARLHAATGGNSFFITECLRLLIEQDALRLVAGRWTLSADLAVVPLPRSIDEAVHARLSTLAADRLDFLRRLAPMGAVLDVDLLHAIVDMSDSALVEALDEAIERQFLMHAHGRYYFAHDTLRSAVYDHTPNALRRQSHERIGDAIARVDPKRVRAVGYHLARSTQPWRAIAPLLRAAALARSDLALLDATDLFREAADLLAVYGDYPDRDRAQVAAWAALVEIGYTSDPQICVEYATRLLGHWATTVDLDEGRRAVQASLGEAMSQSDASVRGQKLAALYRNISVDSDLRPGEVFVKVEEYRTFQAIALAILGETEKASALLDTIGREQHPASPYRAVATTARAVFSNHTGRFGEHRESVVADAQLLLRVLTEMPELPHSLAWGIGISTYMLNCVWAMRGEPLDPALRAAGMAVANRYDLADIRLYHAFADLCRASFSGDGATFPMLLVEQRERIKKLGNPRLPERNLAIFTVPYYLERGELEPARQVIAHAGELSRILSADRWLELYVQVFHACLSAAARESSAREAIAIAKARATDGGLRHVTMLLVHESRYELGHGRREVASECAREALVRATDPVSGNPFDEVLALRAAASAADLEWLEDATVKLKRASAIAAANGMVLQDGLARLALTRTMLRCGAAGADVRAELACATALLAEASAPAWLAKAMALEHELSAS